MATLWILAILVIGAGYLSSWTSEAVNQAYRQQQTLDASIAMQDTQAILFYLLGTRPLTTSGLALPSRKHPFAPAPKSRDPFQRQINVGPTLKLDDQIYRGKGDVLFSIQDEAGLIGANNRHLQLLENSLGLKGIPANHRSILLARLQDYVDHDELYRLNGAEKQQYRKADMPPPPNRPLLTSREVRAILGWKQQRRLWEAPDITRLLNTSRNGPPNINTAPRQVLQSWGVFSNREINSIIETRAVRAFRNFNEVKRTVGRNIPLDPIEQIYLPSKFLRITLWSKKAGLVKEIHLQLTPLADQNSPWLVDHELDYSSRLIGTWKQPQGPGIVLFTENSDEEKHASTN